jgi:hypothetical protein
MRRELVQAKQHNSLNQVILKGFETLSAQNALFKAEIDGLKETIALQKKRQIRSRNLFEKIIDEDGCKAIWFSPAKIARARELQAQNEEAKEQEQRDKELRAQERERVKQEKAAQLQECRAQREEARIEQERLKAIMKAEQEGVKQQRKVDQQLKTELKSSNKGKRRQTGQSEARQAIERVCAIDKVEVVETEVSRGQTRSGRTTRAPKRFEQ